MITKRRPTLRWGVFAVSLLASGGADYICKLEFIVESIVGEGH